MSHSRSSRPCLLGLTRTRGTDLLRLICGSGSATSQSAGRLPTHCPMKEMDDGTSMTSQKGPQALLSPGTEADDKSMSSHSKIIPTGFLEAQNRHKPCAHRLL